MGAALLASPGPVDRNGGHLGFDGNYHLHGGASYQFRYVDASGRMWEGNGPRPEENLVDYSGEILWQTPFIPILIVTSLIGLALYLQTEKWVKRRRHRSLVTRKRQAMVLQSPLPEEAAAPLPRRRPAYAMRSDRRKADRAPVNHPHLR